MHYTLLRNAAALLEYHGHRFLIDPDLGAKGSRPAIANTPEARPNPLVDLPAGWRDLVDSADVYIVTHLHQDHFDATAAEVLAKDLPLIGQPDDAETLQERGFSQLLPVAHVLDVHGISLTRTAGHHGTGEIGAMLAPVSGFVLKAIGEPTLYLAGDTIWCDEVRDAIAAHQPDVIVLNASGARFLVGDPIVMTAEDIAKVQRAAPRATIVIQHLEAINHCLETRAYYREMLPTLGVDMDQMRIPADGESLTL